MVICAFKIAEDQAVLFPTMVHVDGFHLSHVIEPLSFLEKAEIDKFLPEYHHPYALDPAKPVTMGAFAQHNAYTEAKKIQDVSLRASKTKINEVWDSFYKLTGRRYLPIERYRTESADTLIMTMGSFSETAMDAVDNLRNKGINIGLIRIRLWRPFPFEDLKEAVKGIKTLLILDRALSFGGPTGPVCSEIKAALYNEPSRPKIVGFVGGLGGRDMSLLTFENIIKMGIDKASKSIDNEVQMIEVRE